MNTDNIKKVKSIGKGKDVVPKSAFVGVLKPGQTAVDAKAEMIAARKKLLEVQK